MKIASYLLDGEAVYGTVEGNAAVTASAAFRERHPNLRAVLEAEALGALADEVAGRPPDADLDTVAFLPVIANPDKIICVGLNYEMHRKETGRPEVEHPTLFTRFANTQIGHGQPIIKPASSDALDYEGELAVVIGRAGRHIGEDEALAHIAGYACYNDASVRDWQRHTSQFTPGKNFPATGPFGPYLVTTDEVPDPTRLTLVTRLNGTEMQRATTDTLIFSIPRIIAYISAFTELVPGDVIATGTPGGVGFKRQPPVFMKAGDVVEVEITGLGVLRNPIVDE